MTGDRVGLKEEISEQPRVLRDLLQQQRESIAAIADSIEQAAIDYVVVAARGTSDHAGFYLKYLWGIHNRITTALAAPSIHAHYGGEPRFGRALVVGISQSGQSPDIVKVLSAAAAQGVPRVAITNDVESPLAKQATHVIDVCAGPERAVAATKTYTAQLTAIAMLSTSLAADDARCADLGQVPGWVAAVLGLDAEIARIAVRYRYMDQCVVLGRGFNYATAFEWSLKLKELTYCMAAPYSSADFRHGPIAVVGRGYPVFAVVPSGAVADDLIELLERLVREEGAELLAISDVPRVLELATTPIALPSGVPEWLSPIVAIVAAQLFCYHLTCAKGFDTEDPRGLTKVTRSW